MTSLNAQLQWAKEQRQYVEAMCDTHSGEGTAVAASSAESAAVAESALQDLLRDLRGEHGRQFVSSLGASFEELLSLAGAIDRDLRFVEEQRRRSTALLTRVGEVERAWQKASAEHRQRVALGPLSLPSEVAEEIEAILRELDTTTADQYQLLARTKKSASATWDAAAKLLQSFETLRKGLQGLLPIAPAGPVARLQRAAITELDELADRLKDLMRYMIVSAPEWPFTVPEHLTEKVWTIRISPFAYLRAMWNLYWAAIRHPFSETTIDLSTGRVLYRT